MKILFIGGICDGEWRDIKEPLPSYWYVAIMPKLQASLTLVETAEPELTDVERQHYALFRFTRDIRLYIYERLSPDDVLTLLVERYPKPLPAKYQNL